jgi:hypothetical protein
MAAGDGDAGDGRAAQAGERGSARLEDLGGKRLARVRRPDAVPSARAVVLEWRTLRLGVSSDLLGIVTGL